MNFLKFLDVPFVCHMCAHNWWHYYRFRIKKYGQFPFQRRVARQKRTFLAPCGSRQSLVSFGHFGQFLCMAKGGMEIMVISIPPLTFFYGGIYICRVQIKIFVSKLHDICSSEIKTYDISQHFY